MTSHMMPVLCYDITYDACAVGGDNSGRLLYIQNTHCRFQTYMEESCQNEYLGTVNVECNYLLMQGLIDV